MVKALYSVVALAFCSLAASAGAAPQRIVSLNLCADELLLRLAAPEHIKSITWLARDPALSNVSALAQKVPVNQGLAEEIVPLAPDLVIVGAFTTRATVALLRRLGTPLLELGVPQSIDQALAQIITVAAALGIPQRGVQLVEEMTARLAALPMPVDIAARPIAAVYQPNGFTIGQGSLINDLMHRAGLRNLAVERRIDNYGQLPLELLLFAQPDLLIVNDANDRGAAMAYEVLRHPALVQSYGDARKVSVPSAWWSCAGPRLVDTVEKLQRAAQRAMASAPAR